MFQQLRLIDCPVFYVPAIEQRYTGHCDVEALAFKSEAAFTASAPCLAC
jgi:hypothetical protein